MTVWQLATEKEHLGEARSDEDHFTSNLRFGVHGQKWPGQSTIVVTFLEWKRMRKAASG